MRDRTRFARHATINGTLGWTGSENGAAFNFTGSSTSFASAGTLNNDAFSVPFAVSAWVYNLSLAGNPDAGLVAKIDTNPSGSSQYNGWGLLINSSGQPWAYWASGTRATATANVTGVRRWQHLLMQWTGAAVEIYINGRRNVSSATAVAPSAASANLEIGRYRAVSADTLNRSVSGLVDDVRVYRRALTPGEVLMLASQRGIGLVPTRHRRASLLAQFWLNVAGTWKTAKPWINVGGTWRQGSPKIRAGGAWKG